jgi:hypothetical protein
MVIVRRKKSDELFPVATQLGFSTSRITKGQVGLEIECEGNKFRKEGLPKPWSYHKDGSLRGKDNAEYVFATPQKFKDVPRHVDKLFEMFREDGTVLDESNRTSVHVHLNIQDFYLNRLTSLMALWIILEEVLTEWCGEHRVGNLFCLRAKDAPNVVNAIGRFIRSDMLTPLGDGLHYSGMNPQAIVKLGSLEFRTLRGVNEPQPIKDWVSILQRLYNVSGDYPDPRVLCEAFSGIGPLQFFEELLGPLSRVVRDGVTFAEDQIRESMYDGVRMAQDLCYCRDWDRFKAIDLKPDPFGRNIRDVKARLDGDVELAMVQDMMVQAQNLEELQNAQAQVMNTLQGNNWNANWNPEIGDWV